MRHQGLIALLEKHGIDWRLPAVPDPVLKTAPFSSGFTPPLTRYDHEHKNEKTL
jgi:hypothetical protein